MLFDSGFLEFWIAIVWFQRLFWDNTAHLFPLKGLLFPLRTAVAVFGVRGALSMLVTYERKRHWCVRIEKHAPGQVVVVWGHWSFSLCFGYWSISSSPFFNSLFFAACSLSAACSALVSFALATHAISCLPAACVSTSVLRTFHVLTRGFVFKQTSNLSFDSRQTLSYN